MPGCWEQFQQNCAAVLGAELRENKDLVTFRMSLTDGRELRIDETGPSQRWSGTCWKTHSFMTR
jgi:hypothetical protein